MNLPLIRLVALAAVAVCAAAWWALRSPASSSRPPTAAPIDIASPRIASSPTSPALRAAELPSPATTTDEAIPQAELESMAAMFAAEPALIDALEDATSAADPTVREEADRFLNSLELPAPNPTNAADQIAAE